MEASPLEAFHKQKEASLFVGLSLLRTGQAKAFLTTGNTGALVAAASLQLPRLPGIQRPALLTLFPSIKQKVAILDVGGTLQPRSTHFIQYAWMGSIFQMITAGIQCPRVGLLNVGVESEKGTKELQLAYAQLQHLHHTQTQNKKTECTIEFVGNVEARDLFKGDVDVLVTDGFSGNILLKTAEGISSFLLSQFTRLLTKESPSLAHSIIHALHAQFEERNLHGAILCGIDGLVMKCHGATNAQDIEMAVLGTEKLLEQNVISQLRHHLRSVFSKKL